MQNPSLSIVIPALNEEKNITNLLNDILNNTYKDYEIIVSDNGSEDNTIRIVNEFITNNPNIRLVSSEKKGASAARNNGALHATGEYILFLDADQKISQIFIKNCVKETKERNLDVGGHYSKPSGRKFIDKAFWFFCNNILLRPGQYVLPMASTGSGLIIKKNIHDKINGFDETIEVVHDHDYVRRSSKVGKFRMLKHEKSEFNMRRFDEEGRASVYGRYALLLLGYMFNKKRMIVKYEFGRHRKD